MKNFNDIAYDLGAGIQFINSSYDLQNYINLKNTNTWNLTEDRLDDPIEKFVVFSHGVVGSVELGYKQDNEAELLLNYNWIQGIFT